jgi:hypothetical protein
MVLVIFSALERGNEILVISLDVAGAFDRVWHAGLIKKLKAAGMSGKALRLMVDYLRRRFIKVTVGTVSSKLKRIFSSVPQGGKWSAPLWDFEISTLEDLDLKGWLMSYADDCALVYEISLANRDLVIQMVNQDLALLEDWGIEWKVSFEPTKTHSMVISRKGSDAVFDPDGIRFMGAAIEPVTEMKLVGFIFDPKMTMQPMIDHVARKARVKLAAICRLKQHLDPSNLEQMYKAFVRSSIEYGNLVYMCAAASTKEKLDRVQSAAAKMGQFEVESLGSRRQAGLIGFVFKLLDGDGRGMLNEFIPTLVEPPMSKTREASKQRIKEAFDFRDTSRQYDRSIGGQIPVVWKLLPQGLLCQETDKGWQSATKRCQRFLTGKKQENEKLENIANSNDCSNEKQKTAKLSDAFMLANGYYFENGMWIMY